MLFNRTGFYCCLFSLLITATAYANWPAGNISNNTNSTNLPLPINHTKVNVTTPAPPPISTLENHTLFNSTSTPFVSPDVTPRPNNHTLEQTMSDAKNFGITVGISFLGNMPGIYIYKTKKNFFTHKSVYTRMHSVLVTNIIGTFTLGALLQITLYYAFHANFLWWTSFFSIGTGILAASSIWCLEMYSRQPASSQLAQPLSEFARLG